jgi:hypothetical protein
VSGILAGRNAVARATPMSRIIARISRTGRR